MIAARRTALALSILALVSPLAARAQATPAAPAAQAATAPATATPPQPSADQLHATELVRQASALAQQRSFDDALKKLDEAKALDPHQAYLWGSYAYIALTRDDNIAEAIIDLTREIAEHPDERNIYVALARAQTKQHRLTDAAATLQKLVALDPDNSGAVGMLANALIEDKQYSAAEKTIRAVLASTPENLNAQSLLGSVLAREGKKAEALALLQPIATKATDLGVLNNAAYVLADENLDPALAEQTARRALGILQQGTVSGSGGNALFRTEVLVNLWDTLGWALFRQGKIAEAEPWIRPSWANSTAVEPGYHLGMILEKQNQPARAMATYQMAAFGEPGSTPGLVAESITGRIEALRKAGIADQVPDGKAALKAMLTFKIPGANSLTGAATVEFELSAKGAAHALIVKDNVAQDSLTAVEMSLYPIDFKAGIPAAGDVVLTRRGVLTCRAGSPCDFVLLSTGAAVADYNLTAPGTPIPLRNSAAPGSRAAARPGDPYYNTPSGSTNRGGSRARHSKY